VPPPRRATSVRLAPRLASIVGAAVAVAVVSVWLYLVSVHANVANSDAATVMLEGAAMAHGNVVLHGWTLSLDSFWSIDALVYAVADLGGGLHPGLLYAGPAVLAGLVVPLGVIMVRQDRRGASVVVGSVVVVALLALPSHTLSAFLLQGPLHVGTALWSLAAFWALRRGRLDWRYAVAVIILAAGLLGDLQTVAYGVVPVFLAGVVAMARRRSWRAGAVTASAALTSAIVALVGRLVVVAVGGFAIGPTNPRASKNQMLANLRRLAEVGGQLLGVRDTALGRGGAPGELDGAYVIGAALVVAALVAALIGLVKGAARGTALWPTPGQPGVVEDWRLEDMLLLACAGVLVTFVVLALNDSSSFYRYLTAAVIFAAILAGRMAGRWWDTCRRRGLRRSVAAVGIATVICFVAADASDVAAARPTQPIAQLSGWLVAHHLTKGVGGYWSSSITTVVSHGAVTVRPVQADPAGHLVAYDKGPAASWFDHQQFQFLEFNRPSGIDGVDAEAAVTTWGHPEHVYEVGPYEIMVWDHTISVGS
jgi:hypothetical protein